MKSFRKRFGAALIEVLSISLAPVNAHAGPDSVPVATPPPADGDGGMMPPGSEEEIFAHEPISLEGWLGLGSQREDGVDSSESVVAVGIVGLYRVDWLAAGVGVELGSRLFEEKQQRLSALAGATIPLLPWFDVTVLGEAGLHFQQPAEGLQIFGTSRIVGGDTNTMVPYAGLRVDPTLRFKPHAKSHFTLGPTFIARQDLVTTTQHYMRENCTRGLLFDSETTCSLDEDENPVGGFQLMLGLSMGGEFGG